LQVKGDEFCPVVVVVAAAESKGGLIAVVWIDDATPHDDRQTYRQGWMDARHEGGEREILDVSRMQLILIENGSVKPMNLSCNIVVILKISTISTHVLAFVL
jgi:hypothetical protein